MSNKIERTKTGTSVQVKGLGKRGIAIVLCFVMLLTALGTGSLLSTAAVSQSDSSNASEIAMDAASALVKAATNGADAVTASEADEEPFIDDIEDGYDIKASAPADEAENADVVDRFVREENADLAETGWSLSASKAWFFINDAAWTGVKVYMWGDNNWSTSADMTHMSGTGVYKWNMFGSDYSVNGFQFQNPSNSSDNSGNYYKNISQDTVFWRTSCDYGGSTDESLNGTATLISRIATTNGGTYSKTYNSSCVATISTTHITGMDTVTTGDNAVKSTGSSSEVSVYPAYGADVNYSATATGDYVFKGFSTTSSTSLPSGATTSFSAQKSYAHRNYSDGNVSTVYAYFEKKPSYTATITETNGSSTTRNSAAYFSTSSTASTGTTTNTSVIKDKTVYVYVSPKSGYKADVTVNSGAVSVTKDSATKYHFTMPGGAATINVTYSEATYKTVKIYAGTGGTASITYKSVTTTAQAGGNKTIRVYEGDTVALSATAAPGYSFSKWKKNLTDSYKTTASVSSDEITTDTVYVADFSTSGVTDWIASSTAIASSPASASTSEGTYKYLTGSSDNGLTTSNTVTKTGSGNYAGYWASFTRANINDKYLCLAASTSQNDVVGTTGNKVNTTNYSAGTTIEIKDGSTLLFKVEVKKNGSLANEKAYYMHIFSVNSNVSNIGVMTYFDKSNGVNGNFSNNCNSADYQFYYKLSSSSAGNTSYKPYVNYYAKDTGFSAQANTKNTYMGSVDTTVTAVTDVVTVTDDSSNNRVTGKALKGSKITVTTTIPDTGTYYGTVNNNGTLAKSSALTARQKYYVAGFVFNGKTPKLLEWNSSGVYTCEYTIPANMTEDYLEITPVYFIKDDYAYNTAIFYAQGYDNTIQANGWGNTLFVYPYYRYYLSGSSGTKTTYEGRAENFGAYSGQPLLNIDGQYKTQIPLTCDGSPTGKDSVGNPIKGMTISNGYYDLTHRTCTGISAHKQTYDYDDFAKIQTEKANVNGNKLHSIFFTFKYYPEDSSKQHRLSEKTSAYKESGRYRFNDLLEVNNSAMGTASSSAATTSDPRAVNVAESQFTTFGNATTGWEYLTDALGNNVDIFGNAATVTTSHPLKAISMGYEYNNAGTYATEWAIYAYDSTDGKYDLVNIASTHTLSSSTPYIGTNSSIVPSALVLNSSSRFTTTNYPAMDGDQGITGYKDLYTALAPYAGYPVEISYEREASDGNSPAAIRCDGRWTYTTDADFVQSSIIIEYDDKDGNHHRYGGTGSTAPDTFVNTNVGQNTGAKAYFTNTTYNGKVISDSEEISNTEQYTFEAVESTNYEFIGWYLYDKDGNVSDLSTDIEAKTTRSNNYTIAARFKYVASGKVKISHILSSESEGRGTTYLGVSVKNGTSGTPYVIADENSNTGSVTLDDTYINNSDDFYVTVTLKTVPNGENSWSSYSVYSTNTSDVTAAATATNFTTPTSGSGTSTQVFTFRVQTDIFSSNNQVVKALEYQASLTQPTYHYSIVFNYPSRQYGNQSFTVEDDLTQAQISDNTYVGGATGGTNRYLTKAFLQKIMPYESNFNKDINFTLPNTLAASSYSTTSGIRYDFTATYTGTEAANENNNKYANFYVPYEGTISGKAINYTTNGSDADQVDIDTGVTLNDFDTYNTYHISNTYDSTYDVVAPQQIKDGDDVLFFNYWEIKTADNNDGSSRTVGKCYFYGFNYRALDNYDIYAVYSENSAFGDMYDEANYTTVDFIGNNRNQWNMNGKGSAPYYAADLIYNDFILSFKPEGSNLLNTYSSAKVGMIIQKLNLVQMDASGKPRTLKAHADSYTDTVIESGETYSTAQKAVLAKLGVSGYSATGYAQSKIEMNPTDVNNKNRLHYAYKFYNSAQVSSSSANNSSTGALYLYRAYSYMSTDGTNYIISDEPTYFYMYDIAKK